MHRLAHDLAEQTERQAPARLRHGKSEKRHGAMQVALAFDELAEAEVRVAELSFPPRERELGHAPRLRRDAQRALEKRHRLGVVEAGPRLLPRPLEILDRLRPIAALRIVVRERRQHARELGALREPLLDGPRALAVQPLLLGGRQDLVGDLAQAVVDETKTIVGRILEDLPSKQLVGSRQKVGLGERAVGWRRPAAHQTVGRARGRDAEQELGVHFSIEHGRHADEPPRRRAQSFEPPQDEIADRARQSERRQPLGVLEHAPPARRVAREKPFAHRRAQVFGDEEGIASRLLRQKPDERGRGRIEGEHARRRGGHCRTIETAELDVLDERSVQELAKLGADLVRTVRAEHDEPLVPKVVARERRKELERELVRPLQVVEHEHEGLVVARGGESLGERIEQAPARRLRGQIGRIGVILRAREREQLRLAASQHLGARADETLAWKKRVKGWSGASWLPAESSVTNARWHSPVMTHIFFVCARLAISATTDVLPMPLSPPITTNAPLPSRAASMCRSRAAHAASRPASAGLYK